MKKRKKKLNQLYLALQTAASFIYKSQEEGGQTEATLTVQLAVQLQPILWLLICAALPAMENIPQWTIRTRTVRLRLFENQQRLTPRILALVRKKSSNPERI